MPQRLVTVATFGEPLQAQLCRATLSASGIRSFVTDEHLSTINPHYMGATAGIHVQVVQADAQRALDVLKAAGEAAEEAAREEASAEDDDDEDQDGPRCPRCSARYSYYEWSLFQGILLVLLLGLPLLFMQKKWHCRRCGHRFRLPPAGAPAGGPYRRPRRAAQATRE